MQDNDLLYARCMTCFYAFSFGSKMRVQCRRYPPMFTGSDDDKHFYNFPIVHSDDFCGEYTKQWEK